MVSLDAFTKSIARQISEQKGNFAVLEYNKVSGYAALSPEKAFYHSKMGIRKKQCIISLDNNGAYLQQGAMQMMMGRVDMKATLGNGGGGSVLGGLFQAAVSRAATGESAIKPLYQGTGVVVLEPTWKYILLEDLSTWGGSIVTEDGMFLACSDTVTIDMTMRQTVSSVAGGEGLVNPYFTGSGIVALESPLPRDELIEIELNNDVVKIDGNNAIAWSGDLQFTVERSSRSLLGSAASGEGLVNVYRGTGKILVAP